MTPFKQQAIAQQTAQQLEQVMQTRSTEILTVCFGVMCPTHAQCARWQAVNGATNQPRQATCLSADGKRPDFVAVAE